MYVNLSVYSDTSFESLKDLSFKREIKYLSLKGDTAVCVMYYSMFFVYY